MAKERIGRSVQKCECENCRESPLGRVAAEHRRLNRLLAVGDERMRRLLAGFLAEQIGRGGISDLASITGLDRKTIARGRRELQSGEFFAGVRVRRSGAGRKPLESKSPGC